MEKLIKNKNRKYENSGRQNETIRKYIRWRRKGEKRGEVTNENRIWKIVIILRDDFLVLQM